jgi:prevent-host-death family protein
MQQVNIHQAKTQLSKLIEIAASGEEIIIARAGKPVAKLVPLNAPLTKQRQPGALKGKIWIADSFDTPMTEEELAEWYDAPLFPDEAQSR